MSGGQEMTRNLREQEPGRDSRHANAAGTPNIAQGKARAKRAGLYHITPEGGRMTRNRLALLAVSLDPAALAALGLAGARIWGAVT